MPDYNKVILIGRLAADPELRQTEAGVAVCTFKLGIRRSFKSRDSGFSSDVIDIVAWRRQAEFIAGDFKKGRHICVLGSLRQRSWLDRQDIVHSVTEVTAEEISSAGPETDMTEQETAVP